MFSRYVHIFLLLIAGITSYTHSSNVKMQLQNLNKAIKEYFNSIEKDTLYQIGRELSPPRQIEIQNVYDAIAIISDTENIPNVLCSQRSTATHPIALVIKKSFAPYKMMSFPETLFNTYTQNAQPDGLAILEKLYNEVPLLFDSATCPAQHISQQVEYLHPRCIYFTHKTLTQHIQPFWELLIQYLPAETWHIPTSPQEKQHETITMQYIRILNNNTTPVQKNDYPFYILTLILQQKIPEAALTRAYLYDLIRGAMEFQALGKTTQEQLQQHMQHINTLARYLLQAHPHLIYQPQTQNWPIFNVTTLLEELDDTEFAVEGLRNEIFTLLSMLYEFGGLEQFVTPDPDNNKKPIEQFEIINEFYELVSSFEQLYTAISYLEKYIS